MFVTLSLAVLGLVIGYMDTCNEDMKFWMYVFGTFVCVWVVVFGCTCCGFERKNGHNDITMNLTALITPFYPILGAFRDISSIYGKRGIQSVTGRVSSLPNHF